jgi:hypothetical protein
MLDHGCYARVVDFVAENLSSEEYTEFMIRSSPAPDYECYKVIFNGSSSKEITHRSSARGTHRQRNLQDPQENQLYYPVSTFGFRCT